MYLPKRSWKSQFDNALRTLLSFGQFFVPGKVVVSFSYQQVHSKNNNQIDWMIKLHDRKVWIKLMMYLQ